MPKQLSMDSHAAARRTLVNTLIWCLSAAAFVAIAALLSDDSSETTSRILVTSLALALYSVTSLAGLGAAARPALRPLALAIWALSAAGLLAALVWIWDGLDDGALARLAGAAAVTALCAAQVALIVLRVRPGDPQGIRFGEALTCASALLLAVLAVNAIAAEIDDGGYFRALGVIAILDAYGTIAVPLIRVARPSPSGAPRRYLLLLLIAVLTLAAAGGIIGLLRNSVDEDMARMLVTLPFAAVYGVTGLAGAAARRLPRHRLLGGVTMAASIVGFVSAVNLIWLSGFDFEGSGEGDLKWAWALLVGAGTLAHVAVLVVRRRRDDRPATRTLVSCAIAVAAVTGVTLIYPTLEEGAGEGYATWLGTVLILDVLATSLVGLVRKRDQRPA